MFDFPFIEHIKIGFYIQLSDRQTTPPAIPQNVSTYRSWTERQNRYKMNLSLWNIVKFYFLISSFEL